MITDWEKELILEIFEKYLDWSVRVDHAGDGKGLSVDLMKLDKYIELRFYIDWVMVRSSSNRKWKNYVQGEIGDLGGILNRPRQKLGPKVLKMLSYVLSSSDPISFELIECSFINLNLSKIELFKDISDIIDFI